MKPQLRILWSGALRDPKHQAPGFTLVSKAFEMGSSAEDDDPFAADNHASTSTSISLEIEMSRIRHFAMVENVHVSKWLAHDDKETLFRKKEPDSRAVSVETPGDIQLAVDPRFTSSVRWIRRLFDGRPEGSGVLLRPSDTLRTSYVLFCTVEPGTSPAPPHPDTGVVNMGLGVLVPPEQLVLRLGRIAEKKRMPLPSDPFRASRASDAIILEHGPSSFDDDDDEELESPTRAPRNRH